MRGQAQRVDLARRQPVPPLHVALQRLEPGVDVQRRQMQAREPDEGVLAPIRLVDGEIDVHHAQAAPARVRGNAGADRADIESGVVGEERSASCGMPPGRRHPFHRQHPAHGLDRHRIAQHRVLTLVGAVEAVREIGAAPVGLGRQASPRANT
jgi:hypothetical protein